MIIINYSWFMNYMQDFLSFKLMHFVQFEGYFFPNASNHIYSISLILSVPLI